MTSFLDDAREAGGLRGALMSMGPLGFVGGLLGHMFKTDDNPATQALNGIQGMWGGGEDWTRADGSPMQIVPPGATPGQSRGGMQNGLWGMVPGFGGVRGMLQGRR